MNRSLILTILLVVFSSGCTQLKPVNNQPVVSVNGKVILQSQLDGRAELLAQSLALNPSTLPTLGSQQNTVVLADVFKQLALDALIDETLLQEYANMHNIKVSDAEITQRFKAEKSVSFPLINNTDFTQKLKKLGYTQNTFKEQLFRILLKEKIANLLIGKPLKPSQTDIIKYFQAHHAFYDTPETVHVKQILIAANLESAEKNYRMQHPTALESNVVQGIQDALLAQRQEANMVLEKVLATPERFSDLAKQYSADTFSVHEGGDIGYISREMMPPTFSKAAFSTSANTIYPYIIQTRLGFHIIQVLDKKPGQKATISKVEPQIIATLYESNITQSLQRWLVKRREQSKLVYASNYSFATDQKKFQDDMQEKAQKKEIHLKSDIQNQPILHPPDNN